MYKPPLYLDISSQEAFDKSFQNLLDFLDETTEQYRKNPPDSILCSGCHHIQPNTDGFYRCEKCGQSDKGGLCFHKDNPGWISKYFTEEYKNENPACN